jgi:hypothetical protein
VWPTALALLVVAGPTCTARDARVEAVVAATVRATGGTEYCQSRLYHTTDDLDGDGRDDFVLVFAVEAAAGGNNSVQYLAVWLSGSHWTREVLKVGQRGQRSIEGIGVEEGPTLVLETADYVRGDAMCCPSGEGELRFVAAAGRVKEAAAVRSNR